MNGYISQPLINTAKKTKHQWYNFQLQTAPSKVRSISRFNTSIHPHIKLYQDSKTPLLLKDVIVKEDESDCLFNQQSTAYSRTNSDISFQYEEQAKPEKIANQYQIDMLLLNRSQQLNQIKG